MLIVNWCKLQTYQNVESSARNQGCRCDWIRQLLQGKIWRHLKIFNRALAWMLLCAWARSPHQTCVRWSTPNGAHRPSISATKCHVVFLCCPSKFFYNWMPSCLFIMKDIFSATKHSFVYISVLSGLVLLQPYLWLFILYCCLKKCF